MGVKVNCNSRVTEIADYLLHHHGPDRAGRCHPRKKRVQVTHLEEALKLAQQRGLHSGWKAEHFSGTMGLWKDSERVDAVLRRRMDQVLAGSKYGGSLPLLFAQLTQVELFANPLVEEIDGRRVQVSMGGIGHILKGSPYKAICRYLEVRGDNSFSGLRSDHTRKAAHGTRRNRFLMEDLLEKKIDQILQNKYGGDLFLLVTTVSAHELFRTPVMETVGRTIFPVNMTPCGYYFGYSPFIAISRYLEIKGLTARFWGLRPCHMASASKGFWKDKENIREYSRRRADQVLAEDYGGDLERFRAGTFPDQLFGSPLIEWLDGRPVEVSMGRIDQAWRNKFPVFLDWYVDGRKATG